MTAGAAVTKPRPRIYLAGPEVFLAQAREAGATKRHLCAQAGLEGVYPLDGELVLDGLDKHEQARRISLECETMMRSCDAVIANLTPFRGVSADVGTAFEVGFMRALGRPIFGYTNTPLLYHRRSEIYRAGPRLAYDGDKPDVVIEDFDLSENLMITIAIEASGSRLVTHQAAVDQEMTDLGGFIQCLDEARQLLFAGAPGQAPTLLG